MACASGAAYRPTATCGSWPTIGPAATAADLLERCVEAMEGPTRPGSRGGAARRGRRSGWPTPWRPATPGADVTADIECPCGAVWPETVDIRSILWTELTRWVQARLAEVHQLALAYGWAERDILQMSPHRRRFYLESCAR